MTQDYGTLKPLGYIPRITDARLAELLELFGAVEVSGTKWCGKTWSALAFGESVSHVDDSTTKDLFEADPSLALGGSKPHVVDEWQEVPAIWDAARRAIDASGGEKGHYILTGSSTPAKNKVTHSGAGRIARLHMRPMSLSESEDSTKAVSLAGLFEGRFQPAFVQTDLEKLSQAICRGGWPGLMHATPLQAAQTLEQYLDALFDISVPAKGKNAHVARKLAHSLARNIATSATYDTLAADTLDDSPEEIASRNTIASYLELFKDLFFVEELVGWDAPVRSRSRLRTKPKRYFVDPSLPSLMLGMNPQRLLQDTQTFGLLFESLCIRDLRVYTSAMHEATLDPLRYYQDGDGLEVDAIVELRDGRWAGFEIKLGENKVPDGIEKLKRLRSKILANPAARNREPSFMAVLVGKSDYARYVAPDDVYVIPLAALTA